MSIETNNKLIGNLGSSNIKGSGIFVKGETGNGIDRIEKTSSVGLIDTYTIYFTDGNTTTFTITNGKNGIDGVNGTNGENGKSLQFNWNGTQLGIKTEDSTEYTYVDLKGNKGDKGDKGDPGEVTLEQLNTAVGNATKTTQTTEVSESLTIENCAPVSAKLDIKSGKSEQATRSGNNLYNVNDKYSFTDIVSVDKDGWITVTYDNTSGTSTKYFDFKTNVIDKLKVDTNYALIVEIKDITGIGNIMFSQNSSNSQCATSNSYTFINLTTGIKKYTIKTQSDFSRAINSLSSYGSFKRGESGSITFRMSLLEDTSITPETFIYEPYGVMPSPDYPSRIRNVGDNINYIDPSLTLYKGNFTDAGVFFTSSDRAIQNLIELKPDKYILWAKNNNWINLFIYDKNNVLKQNLKSKTGKEIKFEITEKSYIKFAFNPVVDSLEDFKLEPGTIANPYTPYNCGSADFKVENENMLNLNEEDISYSNTTLVNKDMNEITFRATNGTYRWTTIKKYLKVGTYYIQRKYEITEGTDNVNQAGRIDIYTEGNKTHIKALKNTEEKTEFTITKEGNYNFILKACDDKPQGEIISVRYYDFMISKKDSDYIPHQEQIKSFPFTEGQVLHKGDYLASDGIHQKRKTLVLDGTENIVLNSIFTNTTRYYIEGNPSSTNIAVEGFCSHYEYLSNYTRDSEHVYVGNTGRMYIFSTLQSVAQLKEFLTTQYTNGTPVTIEYELAEEIVIPYTEEQEQAYYELQHLLMYEGYTNITCIDEIKPDIQVEYYFNNEVNKTYCKRIDSLEEKIRLLEKVVSSQTSEVSE